MPPGRGGATRGVGIETSMEWFALTVLGTGFLVLIVWVNLYALDDDTPDPDPTDTAGDGEDPGE